MMYVFIRFFIIAMAGWVGVRDSSSRIDAIRPLQVPPPPSLPFVWVILAELGS